MLQVNVAGGTHAGFRRVFAAAVDWVCPNCGARIKYYWTKCPNCDTRRPA